ncbi:MAG: hypothetical protein ABFD98_20185 [Syntrophobacteraceae bacterium]|nr:hypothetical protein [Desulfobacteraceae bacterium]
MKRRQLSVVVCALALLWAWGGTCTGHAQDSTVSYFCQGQAAYNPQDMARSQQDALMDFQAQAILQAIGSFLSPSQMASQYNAIEEKMLKNPERYVETYQVFTESSGKGLFRITGQVTLNVGMLRNDLEESGWMPPAANVAPAPQAGDSAGSPAGVSHPAAATGPPSAADAEMSQEGPRGMVLSRREILWAVAEKWEEEWVVPTDRRDPNGIFAASALQEFQDFQTTLRLPGPGGITVDDRGNISSNQALSLARSLGIPHVVVGSVVLKQNQRKGAPRLETTLRLLNVGSGKMEGEVRKDMAVAEGSKQEGAMELALLVIPQLERLIRDQTGEVQAGGGAPSPGNAVDWTLHIQTGHQYAHWAELEKALRERFKSIQVKGMEFGAGENVVHLSGLEGQSLAGIDGVMLPSGSQVKITAFSDESHSLSLAFIEPPTKTPESSQ